MKSYEEAKIIALKSVRNIHKELVRYFLGCITWDEFVAECRVREDKFNKEVND